MNAVNDNYKPALVIPPAKNYAGVDTFFNGKNLLMKTQAIRLSTVDAETTYPEIGSTVGAFNNL